jgi:ribosomal protein L40E
MVLIICRECGARVSSRAKTCPTCGEPQVPTWAELRPIFQFVGGLALLGVLIAGGWAVIYNRTKYVSDAESERTLAQVMCEHGVRTQLDSTGQAPGEIYRAIASKSRDGVWKITGNIAVYEGVLRGASPIPYDCRVKSGSVPADWHLLEMNVLSAEP